MKTVSKKLFSLLLVAVLLVSVLPFQAMAAEKITFSYFEYDFVNSQYKCTKQETFRTPSVPWPPVTSAPDGWMLDGWVVYQDGMTLEQVNAAPRVNLNNTWNQDTLLLAAAYKRDTYTVSFSTGYADIANPAAITVINSTTFGYNATMPFPNDAPNGYTFGGWQYGDKVLTANNWATEKFTSKANVTLSAKWIPNSLTVTFYRWSESLGAYEGIKAVNVPYGETVKQKDIPSMADVDSRDKYQPIGWQSAPGTGAVAVDPVTAKITANTGFYARYLGDEITITLNPNDSSLKSQTKTVRIGEKVGAYGGKLPTPALTGYVFMGWYVEKDQTAQITKVTDEDIFWNSYNTLYARWAPQGDVRLIVYQVDANNKIYSPNNAPIVDRHIPNGVKGGLLDVDTIEIGKYLPSGVTYQLTGYFDKTGWTDFIMNGIIKPVDYVQVAATGETVVYATVKAVTNTNTNTNNNTGSGSNNTGNGNTGSNKPADPTNPATGDNSMIVASMTVMTLSAAALVVFMQLRKRKMI